MPCAVVPDLHGAVGVLVADDDPPIEDAIQVVVVARYRSVAEHDTVRYSTGALLVGFDVIIAPQRDLLAQDKHRCAGSALVRGVVVAVKLQEKVLCSVDKTNVV